MEQNAKKASRLINKLIKRTTEKQSLEYLYELKAELKPLHKKFDLGKFQIVLQKLITWGLICEKIIKELIAVWTSDKR